AVNTSLELLSQRKQPERQRIIVVSDGTEDSPSKSDEIEKVIARAEGQRVTIDTIWISQPRSRTTGTREALARLTDHTAGFHADATNTTDPEQIATALREISRRIDSALIVSFDRKVQQSASTSELGLKINRDGIGSASMRLQNPIPKSEGAGRSIWDILT